MRHVPPRMSNQPARKAWEIEVPNGEIFSSKPNNLTRKTSHTNTSYSLPPVPPDSYLGRNSRVYDDTGNRIAYRGGWIGRSGRGWGL